MDVLRALYFLYCIIAASAVTNYQYESFKTVKKDFCLKESTTHTCTYFQCVAYCQFNWPCCGFSYNKINGACTLFTGADTNERPSDAVDGTCELQVRTSCLDRPSHFNLVFPAAPNRFFYIGDEVTEVKNVRAACAAKNGSPLEFYPIAILKDVWGYAQKTFLKWLPNQEACLSYGGDKSYCHLAFNPIFLSDNSMYWPLSQVKLNNSYYVNKNFFKYTRNTNVYPTSFLTFNNQNNTLVENGREISNWNNPNDKVLLVCEYLSS